LHDGKGRVCLCTEFLYLPAGYQVGIVLHEIGHVLGNRLDPRWEEALDGPKRERLADEIVRDALGVAIQYENDPGIVLSPDFNSPPESVGIDDWHPSKVQYVELDE